MNTKPLEKFAQNARRQLHEQVAARLERVLTTDSAELRAKARTIAALQKEIERTSRQEVVERVAYTWFNRFCALRYMDVNRYTRVGIVSPAAGFTQPEVLQEAKQGHIDRQVEGIVDREMVLGLLNGSQPSSDPQQEAYRLLLVAACNSYHKPMPFLFEPIDDYSELLMPEDLLSEGSILQGVRDALTPEQCQDVEVIGWLYQFYISEKKDEVIKSKKKIQADEIPAATQLFTPHWIVRYLVENSLGRLWMLNNSGSRLAERMDYYIEPETTVDSGQLSVDSGQLLVGSESDEQSTTNQQPTTNNQQLTTNNFLVVNSPEELRIADPAAGSGHMLTYAFDLLYAIYEEEGYNAVDIPRLILEKNLYGMEIDERAGALAAFALMMKGREKDRRFLRRGVLPNICVLKPVAFGEGELAREPWLKGLEEDLRERLLHDLHLFKEADNFGSLLRPQLRSKEIVAMRERVVGSGGEGQLDWLEGDRQKRVLRALDQAAYLARKHHVVVANPPYMGSRNMNAGLKKFAKENYKVSKSDLFAMFIERGFNLVPPKGYNAMVTMQSWMFLSSYEKLRKRLLDRTTIKCMVHMANGVMGIAFGTAATVWQKMSAPNYLGSFSYVYYEDLTDSNKPREFPVQNERLATASAADFKKIPGSPIAYWVSPSEASVFEEFPSITEYADASNGVQTGNNARFVRFWYEVDRSKIGSKWVFYNKGGSFRKWFGNLLHTVNWAFGGEEIKQQDNSILRGEEFYFREGVTWSDVTSGKLSARLMPENCIFDAAGPTAFFKDPQLTRIGLSLLNTKFADYWSKILNPTMHFQIGDFRKLTVAEQYISEDTVQLASDAISIAKADWDASTTSSSFMFPLLLDERFFKKPLSQAYSSMRVHWCQQTEKLRSLEEQNNRLFVEAYELTNQQSLDVPLEEVTLTSNPHYYYGSSRLHKGNWASLEKQFPTVTEQLADISAELAPDMSEDERLGLEQRLLDDTMREFISYAVGCMFGRYSLDKPGLILANQGETLEDYLRQVPEPTFMPDKDNVIPMLDGDWFPDDISERFKKFLRVTFGEAHYEENLAFIEAAIGRDIRSYFLREFYDHHLKMYSKRPIYWLFSSPNGSFNALIYMHRYRPHTVSVVLNDYLREFRTKLTARRRHLEQVSISSASSQRDKTAALKEMDGIDKVLNELRAYEDEVLYPLATEQVVIDLDDGVKVNYGKLGKALKYVRGLS